MWIDWELELLAHCLMWRCLYLKCGILTCLHGLLQVTMETCVRMPWMPVTPVRVSTMELAMRLAPPPTPALVQAVRGWTFWTGPALYWRWQAKQDPLDWSIPFQSFRKRLLLGCLLPPPPPLGGGGARGGVGGTKVALPSPPHIEEMRVFCWLAYFHWFIGSRDHFLGLCKSAEKIWGYICNKLEVFRVKFSKHGLVFDFVLEWFSFRSPTSILLVYTRNDSRQYDCG